jgi:hypothetical protein
MTWGWRWNFLTECAHAVDCVVAVLFCFPTLHSNYFQRTAATIQAAYEERQAIKALEGPPKEGLEGWIEKAKGYYFFGLFEGETGQQAPWFLRPSITFPIAFLIVGAAFAVSYATGAISERGAAVTDELDEFILSSVMTNPSTVLAMMMATLPLDI